MVQMGRRVLLLSLVLCAICKYQTWEIQEAKIFSLLIYALVLIYDL